MMLWSSHEYAIEDHPMTSEEAYQIDRVLKESRELGKRIMARQQGQPLPPSWQIILHDREEEYKRE